MNRDDLTIRVSGMLTMGAGWGACFWLRALTGGPPHDPTLLEFGLVLASFVLTLGGLVALLGGSRLVTNSPHEQPYRTGRGHRSVDLRRADERAMIADVLTRRGARRRRR
jgi:hypothetical protein